MATAAFDRSILTAMRREAAGIRGTHVAIAALIVAESASRLGGPHTRALTSHGVAPESNRAGGVAFLVAQFAAVTTPALARLLVKHLTVRTAETAAATPGLARRAPAHPVDTGLSAIAARNLARAGDTEAARIPVAQCDQPVPHELQEETPVLVRGANDVCFEQPLEHLEQLAAGDESLIHQLHKELFKPAPL